METKLEMDLSTTEMSLADTDNVDYGSGEASIVKQADDSYDKVLRTVGSPGRFQIMILVVLAIGILPTIMSDFASIFYGAPSEATYCKIPEHHLKSGLTVPQCLLTWKQYNESLGVGETVDYFFAKLDPEYCHIMPINGSLSDSEEEKKNCRGWPCAFEVTHNFSHPREWTVLAQWGLACYNYWKFTMSMVVYFTGAFLGYMIFDVICKRLGYKCYMGTRFAFCIAITVGFAFETSLWMLVVSRFTLGILVHGIRYSSIRLMFDLLPSEQRRGVIILQSLTSGVGLVLLGILAYAIKDWRFILMGASIFSLIGGVFTWSVPESLRWLMCHSQVLQAQQTFYKLLEGNRQFVPHGADNTIIETTNTLIKAQQNHVSWRILLRSPQISRPFFSLVGLWFVVNAVNYGVLLSIPNMGGNIYLNVIMSGAMEICGIFAIIFTMQRVPAQRVLFACVFVGGLLCLCSGFIPEGFDLHSTVEITRTALLLLGRVGLGSCSVGLFEMYFRVVPASVISNSFGTFSAIGLLGAVLGSCLTHVGRFNKEAGFVLFGLLAICSAFLTFSLPSDEPTSRMPERSISPEFVVADEDEEMVFEQLPDVAARSPYKI